MTHPARLSWDGRDILSIFLALSISFLLEHLEQEV
jgi:hypothetical protein